MNSLSNIDPIAASSAVVALCALGTSIWQGYISRRHNILSVQPRLDFELCAIPGEPLGLRIKNCGLGPAVITLFEAQFEGVTYNIVSHDTIFDLAKAILPKTTGIEINSCIFHEQATISPEDTVQIISVTPSENHSAIMQHLSQSFINLSLKISYECIYGEKHESSHNGKIPTKKSLKNRLFWHTPKTHH